jgi:hypothetical protein
MKYIDTRILYIFGTDGSLGDSLTNFHADLCVLKEKFPRSVIHTIVHPRTYNTGVTELLLNKGIVDFVYPINLTKESLNQCELYISTLLNINFQVVLHNGHNTQESVDFFMNIFTESVHIQNQLNMFDMKTIHEYFNVTEVEFLEILKKSYRKHYITDIHDFIDHHYINTKLCGLFFGSTRELANVSSIGIIKIINMLRENEIIPVLYGSREYNVYDPNNKNWDKLYNLEYKNSLNMIGLGWHKTISLLHKMDFIICGPTGAAMIPPLFNLKMLLIKGGDSKIMEDCIRSYSGFNNIKMINCLCENYPCGYSTSHINQIKYEKCNATRHPYCLNEEINIDDIKNKML